MKKVLVVFSILAFLAASSISVNTAVASELSVEMVKFDKDPSKDGDKKASKSKDAKASCGDAKASTASDAKAGCGSAAVGPKSGCCKGETKTACGGAKSASSTPDKQ